MLYAIVLLIILFFEYHALGVYYLRLHRIDWVIADIHEDTAGFLLSTASILMICAIVGLIGTLITKVFVSNVIAEARVSRNLLFVRVCGALTSMALMFGLAVFVDYVMLGT